RECLTLEAFVEPRSLGAVYSNLGAVLYESGELDAGESNETAAIEIYMFSGKPMNLSIAWCHVAMVQLQKDDLTRAWEACERSISFARQDDYRRGLAMGELIRAEIFARRGDGSEARAALESAFRQFSNLNIEEGLNYEFAGRVVRLIGNRDESIRYLEKGISISAEFPMALAGLHVELARSLATSDPVGAKHMAEKAEEIFRACEAPLRSCAAKMLAKSIA
ncbi:MAG: hypothetical protein AAB250_04680, partial [Bdellovibrionota bacterium]